MSSDEDSRPTDATHRRLVSLDTRLPPALPRLTDSLRLHVRCRFPRSKRRQYAQPQISYSSQPKLLARLMNLLHRVVGSNPFKAKDRAIATRSIVRNDEVLIGSFALSILRLNFSEAAMHIVGGLCPLG
ncbi:hypothetical protein NXC24_PA00053 (plasmid) [Rhizobium sp. NXC24]|nr:hypothetical protein NXC24_PA00053 [Rhizobium sp. NXC24]